MKARTERKALALEDLKGIRERATVQRKQRHARHCWAFGQLREFIGYKAQREGVGVVHIDWTQGSERIDRIVTIRYNAPAEEAGRTVEAIPPHFTSQRCSRCGRYVQKSLSVRTHICPSCGFVADRDVNAAINILQARTGPSRSVQ